MKAAVIAENGGPEVLTYAEIPDPVCADDGIVIDVETISIEVLDAPRFANSALNNGNVELQWPTRPGQQYAIDYKDDLNAPAWMPLWTNTATGSSLSFTNAATNAVQQFFRIRTVN